MGQSGTGSSTGVDSHVPRQALLKSSEPIVPSWIVATSPEGGQYCTRTNLAAPHAGRSISSFRGFDFVDYSLLLPKHVRLLNHTSSFYSYLRQAQNPQYIGALR